MDFNLKMASYKDILIFFLMKEWTKVWPVFLKWTFLWLALMNRLNDKNSLFWEKMSCIRFNFCKFHGEITSKFIMFSLSWVIKGWWNRFGSVVYGRLFQDLRRPRRWQKCKQTAKNDPLYRFLLHPPCLPALLNFLSSWV